MPKSKRDKKISLTKVDKKNHAFKEKVVDDIKNCVDKFNSIYVFTFRNMRNEKMKDIRQEWKPSRFFFGKNKVIAIGLGRTKEEEVQDDLSQLSQCLRGQCGLLFTDSTVKETEEWFNDFSYEDFARSGFKVDQTVELKAGPLKQFAHPIEPYLRQLGMPTALERGVVTLIKDFEVCRTGSVLTPEQAKILKLLDSRLATFKLVLKARWRKSEGFHKYDSPDDENQESEEDEEMIAKLVVDKKSKKLKAIKKKPQKKGKKQESEEEGMDTDGDD